MLSHQDLTTHIALLEKATGPSLPDTSEIVNGFKQCRTGTFRLLKRQPGNRALGTAYQRRTQDVYEKQMEETKASAGWQLKHMNNECMIKKVSRNGFER